MLVKKQRRTKIDARISGAGIAWDDPSESKAIPPIDVFNSDERPPAHASQLISSQLIPYPTPSATFFVIQSNPRQNSNSIHATNASPTTATLAHTALAEMGKTSSRRSVVHMHIRKAKGRGNLQSQKVEQRLFRPCLDLTVPTAWVWLRKAQSLGAGNPAIRERNGEAKRPPVANERDRQADSMPHTDPTTGIRTCTGKKTNRSARAAADTKLGPLPLTSCGTIPHYLAASAAKRLPAPWWLPTFPCGRRRVRDTAMRTDRLGAAKPIHQRHARL
ncbi:hypothetical protein R3P38DRAFT_3197654 [Favolaschia claudopus]|uniref:Uncharacterized protein n=1 Tax=Favolaschia claudopus TaxID=2862362 RepID=A0AAW0B2H0_9AGAR